MEGPLSKWTNIVKGWQFRWFVLEEPVGVLSYYLTREKRIKNSKRGVIPLENAIIGIDDEDDSTFTITSQNHTYHFQARNVDEKERWIEALELIILRLKNPKPDERSAPSLEIFDNKLAESDAYLQILMEQVKETDQKIEQSQDEAVKERYTVIKQTAESVIESVKQSIVLLQIAKAHIIAETPPKSTDLPENVGKHQSIALTSSVSDHAAGPSNLPSKMSNRPLTPEILLPHANLSDDGIHQQVPGEQRLSTPSLATRPSGGFLVDKDTQTQLVAKRKQVQNQLDTSHQSSVSSSDDEQYFDCDEHTRAASAAQKSTAVSPDEAGQSSAEPPPVVASQFDHYDELYDDDAVEDVGSVHSHGSIISHLMSQVRIGMDLTKIVLPTFILERRSLLEMFADFLAHPDIFISIADQETPQDRMIQCVRWYLSAFHAGRRTDVAKKPYNPILGETFQCCYDLPEPAAPYKDQKLVTDGPVPWATQEHICFIAEQVSHHPPISAFYAEHYNKGIALDGYIWTKSKFLGLSIGVHMVGKGVVSVLKHEEEYIITFPNAYGRSILTVPWMELGGTVSINCAKTGYKCNIEFLTKPFYGGKKDQVTAEIFAPNEKKPFCSVKGEWNGVMWAKYTSGMNEMFVDTKTSPIRKKLVRPLEEQDDTESRKLWRDVTYHLKYKNIEKATDHKRELEDNQRKAAKDRESKGAKWETKYFHEVGEHWVYRRPLQSRTNHQKPSQSETV